MNPRFKQIFLKATDIMIVVNVVLYSIACLTPYINPALFFPLTFLALGFPLLLLSMFFWLIIFFFFKRKKVGLMLICILLGYKNIYSTIGFNFSKQISKPSNINTFRVLSWNIKNFTIAEKKYDIGNNSYRKILDFIKTSNADIVCLQDFEEHDSSIFIKPKEYIVDSLGYKYSYFSKAINKIIKTGNVEYGVYIFSKYSITNSKSIQYNNRSFPEQLGFIDVIIKNEKLRIFNTHLKSMYLNITTKFNKLDFNYVIDDTNLVFHSTIFEKLKRFDTAHCNQALLIKKILDTTSIPFIFCADINSVPSSFVYQHISKNLNDAFVQNGFGWGGTYSNKLPFLRIDVVLMSKQLNAVNYFSPKLEISDHYPIIADISFAK